MPALAILLLLVAGTAAATPPPIDYLYVAANEGSSAGGHTAIRFGNETFHFQHHPGGVLRIHRDDSQRFLQYYSRLQNRTVRASHISVSTDTYDRVHDAFVRRTLAQDGQFDLHAELQRNVEMLDALQGRAVAPGAPPGAVFLRGAGFFVPGRPQDTAAAGSEPAPALVSLRDRVAAEKGPAALDAARETVDEALVHLAPTFELPPNEPSPDVLPVVGPTFAGAYIDLLTTRLALEVLAEARPLRSDAVRAPPDPAFTLDAAERETLRTFAARLSAEVATLVTSPRPDRGFALLIGMARLEALERSVRTGRLVVLDAFPDDAVTFAAAELAGHRDVLVELLDEAGEQLAAQRAQLTVPLDEAGYADLEAATNRLLELQRAAHDGTDLRAHAGRLLPSRGAWSGDLVWPALSPPDVPAARVRAAAAADAYWAQLAEAYRYNVVTRNCVSEVFATIDRGLAELNDGGDAVAASARHLGGHVPMPWPFNFIPFVSAGAVEDTYRVDGTTVTIPYRQVRIAEMLAHEPAWRVHLRESNTLTSTLYDGTVDDSSFVFFTDDVVWTRPLFGAVNLAAGTAATAAGLLTAPLDRGQRLQAGIYGIIFSVPELAFLNVRKGTFPYVPRAYRVDVPGDQPS